MEVLDRRLPRALVAASVAAAEGGHGLTITGTGTGLAATVGVTLNINSLNVTGRVGSAGDHAGRPVGRNR